MLRVNSKEIEPGDTFLALTGLKKDGHDYIEEAIDKGAVCIIATHGQYSVKTILTDDTRTYLSNYLKELNLEKLNKIKLIGIVGTSGKTITGDLTYQLLNNLNIKTAYIGTNGFYLNGKVHKLPSTTPDIYQMYDLINKAIENECETIIIEVSSKAVKQRHIEGLRFDIAIFTNFITNNIKEDEKEAYLNTKIELFKMLKSEATAIINKNDPYYSCFALPQNKNIFYGPMDSNYPIQNINLNYDYTEFDINGKHVKLPIIGAYNIYNYAAAYLTACALYVPDEAIISATLSLHPVDGRFQNIKYKDNLIIIDYAYDLEMISNVLNETKKYKQNKIITVVGCGGERRQAQRPLIGKLVTEESDEVIFTTDNPRHENEEDIINDMTSGVNKENYIKITNRKEAIKKGIDKLEEKDILLILGKGHEDSQIIGNDAFPFKDYNEVVKLIK